MLLRMICRTQRRSHVWCRAHAVSAPTQMAAMQRQKAYVRYKPGADNLTICLVLAGKQRNLNRPADEPLEKPFTRIRANLVPTKQDKRNKKKKLDPAAAAAATGASGSNTEQQQQQQELFVGLFRDAAATEPIDVSTPNSLAWTQATLLKVGEEVFDILLNPPTVETLDLQDFPMSGYPLLPVVALAFANADLCKWRWLRQRLPAAGSSGTAGGGSGSSSSKKDARSLPDAAWEETGCLSVCYTPSSEDIGCVLRVECTPAAAGNGGQTDTTIADIDTALSSSAAAAAAAAGQQPVYGEASTADTGPVQPGPEQPAARIRQLNPGTPLAEPWRFRVMSYNILADQYAGTSYAQQVLFNYCPKELLDNNYRRQLVLEEIRRYQPDICCLQEVDDKVFSEYLQPHLRLSNFRGHYTNKQGKVREGSAMFWSDSKWGCAAVQDILLRDVFKPPLAARHSQFKTMLDASPALTEALQKVTTIAQMLLLVPRGTADPCSSSSSSSSSSHQPAAAPLLVINTHLFFHPYAPHIRSLHTAAILEEAAAALAEWQQQAQQQQQQQQQPLAPLDSLQTGPVEPHLLQQLTRLPKPTLLFCGDLNSDLNDGVPGVVEMLQTGRLAADHWDWKMGATFSWGKSEEEYGDEEQQQQQQQEQVTSVLADGHDFEPATASPTASIPVIGVDVAVPFVLRSADDLATPYTNYTSGYKALLDYVWYDPTRVQVTRQLPVPAEQLLSSFIPSPNFPSDHLAVVYDLAFKQAVQAVQQQGKAVAAAAAAAAAQHDSGLFMLLPASHDHVPDAVAALSKGLVVALPTDTLYGFAAAASCSSAVDQMRKIKSRSPDVPFAVAVADVSEIDRYCHTEQLPEGLLRALLPGPVTVLLPMKAGADLAAGVLSGHMHSDGSTGSTALPDRPLLGVRVVPNEFVKAVCRQLGEGVALTSANPSGAESSLRVQDFRELWQHCGAVFDGGSVPISSKSGSTVVDLSQAGTFLNSNNQQEAAAERVISGELADEAVPGLQGVFRLLRPGVAAESVVELLTKAFGLQQL